MLEMEVDVVRGIMFIHLEGELTKRTFSQFDELLNYLLYKKGMHYYVFNFKDLDEFDANVISWLDNKLVEIFLSCGKVALCVINKSYEEKIGRQDMLFYVNEGYEAFKYLVI